MTGFLCRHKQRLSSLRLEVDGMTVSHEIVPSIETAAVQAFAAELSPVPPVRVPLRDDDDGLYGWPADGVREKIRTHGGSIRFGWRLRESPDVVPTAEFHAVWVDPEGTLVDITPAVTGDGPSVFVPDPNYPATFDVDQCPPTRYRVLHTAPDLSGAIAERIAQMKPSQRAYEERRAAKVGKTLEDWILGKFPAHPLLQPIAAFVDACQAFDARLPGLPGLIRTAPDTIANEIIERARLADAAGAATAADALTQATIEEVCDQDVSGEPAQTADAAPADAPADAADAPADAADAPADAADAPAEAAGDATADRATSDDSADESDETGLPEYETAVAEDELFNWSDARFDRRRDIMRLMPPTWPSP